MMLMKKKLPIVFTCDDRYFKYTCVVIRSLIANSQRDVQYNIHIVSEYISPNNRRLAAQMLEGQPGFLIAYHIITVKNRTQYHLNSYMSLSTYYRFFIFDLLKDEERVLYLDSDVIVENDISYLAELDFEDKAAACSPSPYVKRLVEQGTDERFTPYYFKEVLRMSDAKNYFNAGVILFNLKKIRAEHIDRAFFTALSEIIEPVFQDQDILNAVLHQYGGVKMLSNKMNYTPSLRLTYRRILFNALRYRFFRENRNPWFSIYHYVGQQKPWQHYAQDSALFYYYAFKTPFLKSILKENPNWYKKADRH